MCFSENRSTAHTTNPRVVCLAYKNKISHADFVGILAPEAQKTAFTTRLNRNYLAETIQRDRVGNQRGF